MRHAGQRGRYRRWRLPILSGAACVALACCLLGCTSDDALDVLDAALPKRFGVGFSRGVLEAPKFEGQAYESDQPISAKFIYFEWERGPIR